MDGQPLGIKEAVREKSKMPSPETKAALSPESGAEEWVDKG